jgi:DNA-directed RNA polymerase subunit RPC12/RpoP
VYSDAIKKLASSKFIANRASHDSAYTENISDLKTVYDDLVELEGLFRCTKCSKRVSTKNQNKVKKTMSCGCGSKEILWKG